MQAAIEVDQGRLLLDDPLVQVLQDVAAVAAVGLVADDDGLALELCGDQRGVAHADRVADEDDLGNVFLALWRLGLDSSRPR